jgi:hypothetical protein
LISGHAAALAASGGGYDSSLSWVGGPSLDEIESREREQVYGGTQYLAASASLAFTAFADEEHNKMLFLLAYRGGQFAFAP